MNKIELSHFAREDISDILIYTRRRYGEGQCAAYSDLIFHTLETIAANPDIGHSRPDMPPIYRACGFKKHVVVYRKIEETIFVARILHANMDFKIRT